MSENEVKAIPPAEIVERAAAKVKSKQPRFNASGDEFFGAVYSFLKRAVIEQRPYKVDSRRRDQWLRETWPMEPYWASVIKGCTLLDKNRPWSLTGGRNQVARFTPVLTQAVVAPDVVGWRHFAEIESTAFYTSDLGPVTEIGRQSKNGPMREIIYTDPARCYLTGDPAHPLRYKPRQGAQQEWRPDDYFRVFSMPSTDEGMRGLGYCATSMAFELLVLLYGVLTHDQEKIGARMPEGLMLIQGVSQDQWEDALENRKADLDAESYRRFGALMVLATEGPDPPTVTLEAISSLPSNFERRDFMETTWFGYAAIVGRDASEFFPVQTGSIGRGNEPDVQHRKASKKGGADFILEFQEQFQQELPDSLLFEFEERDLEGQLLEAEVAQAWVDVIDSIQYGGSQIERIDNEQFLSFLVDKQIVPEEWTEFMEEVTATDTEQRGRWREIYRDRVLDSPDIRRAIEKYPSEPIVCAKWRPFVLTETTLWRSGAEALARISWPATAIRRQAEDEGEVLFEGTDFQITDADVDRAIADAGRRVPGDGTRDDPGMQALLEAQEEPEE